MVECFKIKGGVDLVKCICSENYVIDENTVKYNNRLKCDSET